MASFNTSVQPGDYFQTDTSIAEVNRKALKAPNKKGDPVKFRTKLLAVQVNYLFDAGGDVVFVAEAGGLLTSLRLSTNKLSPTPQGPKAPLTCLTAHATKTSSNPFTTIRIFAGCWDKSVWQYSFRLAEQADLGRAVTEQRSFDAHQDFVKCLIVAQTPDKQEILITGGADGDIRFWTLGGQPCGSLKPGSRAIEDLALDPLSSPDNPVVFFSTSKREIYHFTIPDSTKLKSTQIQLSAPIMVHETSVYKLHFDDDGDLWTASADKTAKHLSRDHNWASDTTLQHPDYVRDVLTHDRYGWVVTACRDEEVRVWDKASGDLHHVFSGHYEGVTGLALSNDLVISVSIDATLRRWSLAPADLQAAVQAAKNPPLLEVEPEPSSDLPTLTEEEEAELKALMEDE